MLHETEDVFEIKLNDEGIARLRQTLTITRMLVVIGSIEIFIFICDSVLRQLMISETAASLGDTTYSWLMTYFYPAYCLLYAVFYIAYLIHFSRFTKRANASIINHDTQAFNQSFRFLASAMRMAFVVVILNFVIWTVFFIMELGYYKKNSGLIGFVRGNRLL